VEGIEKRHFYGSACVPDFAHELDKLPNVRREKRRERGEQGEGEEEGGRESAGMRREENGGREGEGERGRQGGREAGEDACDSHVKFSLVFGSA
jgi:hypothetical protein